MMKSTLTTLATRPLNFGIVVMFSLLVALSIGDVSVAQEQTNTLSIGRERRATLEEFNITEVPDLEAVRTIAAQLFAKPLEQQDPEQLRKLSQEANRAANLVNYIYDEYDDYYKESYRYDFVQKEVRGPAREYERTFNEFIEIRNRAYFNLGIISRNNQRTMEALLYFRDAFRLSNFDCGSKKIPHTCMRWKAEQEIQKLLGLSHIESYISWQK